MKKTLMRKFWKKFRWKNSYYEENADGEIPMKKKKSDGEYQIFSPKFKKMVNKYYQKHKERLQKEAHEKYLNLSK